MFRSLLAAFVLGAALLTLVLQTSTGGSSWSKSLTEPSAPAGSAADRRVLPGGSTEGVSLVQKSWGVGKVALPGSRRSSWDVALRVLLGVIVLVCVAIAHGGSSVFSQSPGPSPAQPRRLAAGSVRALGPDASAAKATHDAARRNVALLRVKGLTHRLARLDEGEEGVRHDDRDYARIRGYLARAEAYAQRQQYEKAADVFREGTHMAEDWLTGLKKIHARGDEIDEASVEFSDAVARSASFFLERGQVVKAKNLLQRAAPLLEGRTDITSMRITLLEANADRDAGMLDEATAGYGKVFAKMAGVAERASPPVRAALEALAAEASVEHARAVLCQGQTKEALGLLEDTSRKLAVFQGPHLVSSSLVVRLNGWLGLAHLKQSDPTRALDSLDTALDALGDLPAGLAGATHDVQDILQTRVAAKVALGREHSAADDLQVLQALQDELFHSVNDGHNTHHAFGGGSLPDPRLWASLARTATIAAELKLRSGHAKEALPLAKRALRLLGDLKTDGGVPKGCALADLDHVEDILAEARSQSGTAAFLVSRSQEEKVEEDSGASHDR